MDQDGVFDAKVVATYDTLHNGDPQVLKDIIACLKDLADGGAALEFAIGTGRIALSLHDAGTPLVGLGQVALHSD